MARDQYRNTTASDLQRGKPTPFSSSLLSPPATSYLSSTPSNLVGTHRALLEGPPHPTGQMRLALVLPARGWWHGPSA